MRDVLITHQKPIVHATAIRSTVLQSSLAALRARGHFEAWFERVEPRFRDQVVESLAPSWLPMEVGLAHYAGCEALQLPAAEQLALGEAVGDRIQGTFLATLMKTARASGFNPMVIMRQFDRLFARLFQGGSVELAMTGPKDLEVEVAGVPLCRYGYFRTALTGVVRAGIAFSGVRKSYVNQQSHSAQAQSMVLRASWV